MQAIFQMAPLWYWGTLVTLLGLVMGSFLSVCIYRIPRGLSVVSPPSFCPTTNKPIPWHENIPVIGYLRLRGRTRAGTSIPLRYLILELLTGALYLAAFLHLQPDLPRLGVALFLIPWAITLAYIDFDTMEIPYRLTLGVLPLAVFFATCGLTFPSPVESAGARLVLSLEGAMVGVGVVMIVYFYYMALRNIEPWGMGDAQLFAVIGALYGPSHVLPILVLAAFVGLGFTLSARLQSSTTPKLIPFGPSIVIAGVSYFFLPVSQLGLVLQQWLTRGSLS